MTYLNIKTSQGIETVDELNPKDFETRKAFRKELKRLCGEYRLCDMAVYSSQRSTNEWRNKLTFFC